MTDDDETRPLCPRCGRPLAAGVTYTAAEAVGYWVCWAEGCGYRSDLEEQKP